ncbi:MAG TPA: murein biosynthesis integral membrane protein MurJ [Acidobacteriota bacterium]|nr:murein biosynthesis integral membrane protein MurJ [Acidobacteriota bacterium]
MEKQAPSGAASETRGHAFLVASGIFLSRLAGFIRVSVFAHYFGNSDAADAFNAALRIPNFLQNLFGEGVLSASLIPVYAGLRARGREDEAQQVAGAVASLLALVVSILVLIGIPATPYLIDAIAPGFEGEKRLLAIRLVQILFPGTGLLVMSAWCLGILNSHRKFFLSYSAPVIWNAAIIAVLLMFGASTEKNELAVKVAWGAVVGSALQFGVQLPVAISLLGRLRLSLGFKLASVREVVRNFVPVVTARGVVQISAYVDNLLASLLPTGAVSALTYAQTLYLLPVSLFGMSVSAAELPAMSSAVGTLEEVAEVLRGKLNSGLRRIAFLIVPSAMAFLALGDVIAAAVYQSGEFKHTDTLYVWGTLAGSAIGLLATTLGRLYSSAFYALHDTRTPLRFALIRVALTTILGYLFALHLPALLHIDARWGVAGLTSSAGLAAWLEFSLLRHNLNSRIGSTGLSFGFVARLWASAFVAAVIALGVEFALPHWRPLVAGAVILGAYALVYFAVTMVLRVPEALSLLKRIKALRR